MDRRLIGAYDKMTMPEDCTRRIEEAMGKKAKTSREQRYTQVLKDSQKNRAWGTAIALVCLVLVLSVGGTVMFLGIQGQMGWKASNLPEFSETAHTPSTGNAKETEYRGPRPYTEEELEFLEKMCHVMPAWDGYSSLDDVFWTEFTVRLLNDFVYPVWPENTEGLYKGRVTTLAGDAILMDGKVSMKWEKLNAFVQEVMGCQMPQFTPSGEYGELISYIDGTYLVQVTAFPKQNYILQDWKKGGELSRAVFGIHTDPASPAVGQISFQLWAAENERGYIIIGRPTEMRMTQIKNQEIEQVALTFAEGYFAGDVEVMGQYLSSREDSSLILNPFVQGAYVHMEKDKDYQILGVRVFSGETGAGRPVAFVDYAYIPIRDYPSHSLMLEMAQTEEGWKVRGWNEGNRESYDPDRGEIFDTAVTVTFFYKYGNAEGIKDYMASGSGIPPVYQGEVTQEEDGKYPLIQDIQIYFDPMEANDAGEMMADAYIEMKPSKDAMNPIALYLHFVKQEGTWKVERIGEG